MYFSNSYSAPPVNVQLSPFFIRMPYYIICINPFFICLFICFNAKPASLPSGVREGRNQRGQPCLVFQVNLNLWGESPFTSTFTDYASEKHFSALICVSFPVLFCFFLFAFFSFFFFLSKVRKFLLVFTPLTWEHIIIFSFLFDIHHLSILQNICAILLP